MSSELVVIWYVTEAPQEDVKIIHYPNAPTAKYSAFHSSGNHRTYVAFIFIGLAVTLRLAKFGIGFTSNCLELN